MVRETTQRCLILEGDHRRSSYMQIHARKWFIETPIGVLPLDDIGGSYLVGHLRLRYI